ncbi:MAG: peptidase S10 [Candidatus Eremiobacteraeota bacterium]|nr:peptidase S10 [Candidatus Eremiobacteraeota bacterium]
MNAPRTTFAAALLAGAALALLGATPGPRPSASPHHGAATPVPDAVSHASVNVGGGTVRYTARAGTISLKNAKEQLSARIFYVAYTKDGADANRRPVTFFYNGGPGSSTIWLHMASFAPVRVATDNATVTAGPPYRLLPNAYSLIDKSDLIFVDAPNTGYSRVVGAGEPKDFMGVDQDARAFQQFIVRYLSANARWNSPKFLFGESYGTTRDCVLVNMLQGAGVQMNGVVLLSSVLNFGLGGGFGGSIGGGDWSSVFYLPTEAAAAWHHHKAASHGLGLQAFTAEVERFATTRYLHALARGADLPQAEFDAVAHVIAGYLGVSDEYVRNSNLRIAYPRFAQELLRDRATVIGRYDARFTTFNLDNAAERAPWDPSDVGISGAIVGSFNRYVRSTLHYSSDLLYRPTSSGDQLGAPWDMHHGRNDPPANVAPDLAEAMTTNPHLHVFSANGYYDFATPYFATEYTLQHLTVAPQIQKHITFGFYPSGHMVYLNPLAIGPFKKDLARWYDDTLAGR